MSRTCVIFILSAPHLSHDKTHKDTVDSMRQLKCRYIDLFQQPPSSQERGSGLAVGRQGGPGSTGGPGAVDQARDLSPCLPASMGDAARPTTLPCSPPAAHLHGSHHTPLHQTHCGTNNNCYDGSTTPYESRDYDSPGGTIIFLPVEGGLERRRQDPLRIE